MSTKTKKIQPKGVRLNWKPINEVKTVDIVSIEVRRNVMSDEALKKKRELTKSANLTIVP